MLTRIVANDNLHSTEWKGSPFFLLIVLAIQRDWIRSSETFTYARENASDQLERVVLYMDLALWACSLVGRAPRLHRGGHGFESRRVHQSFLWQAHQTRKNLENQIENRTKKFHVNRLGTSAVKRVLSVEQKELNVHGGCLGFLRRWRTRQAALSFGKLSRSVIPGDVRMGKPYLQQCKVTIC